MEGAGFRSFIIFFLLAILAFIAGSLASEKATEALIPVAMVVGVFFLLYLGKNCWVLLFIAPPIFNLFGASFTKGMPLAYLLSAIILAYMIALSMLGHIKIKWQSLPVLDILTFLLCGYVIATWVRYPVTINAFTSITDFGYHDVGGAPYIWCIAAMVYYVAMGIVNVKMETLIKVLKWSFILTLTASVFLCIQGLITGNVQVGEEVASTRFGAFLAPSSLIFRYITAKYSVVGILFAPWKLALIVACCIGVAVSGFRSAILNLIACFTYASIFLKKFTYILMIGLLTWGALVYLSHQEDFSKLPHGIQRVLSAVPGVELGRNNAAAMNAEGSTEWRVEMWKWAMDPSKGYIKDYVWGDGVRISQYDQKLTRTATGFGLINRGSNTIYAATGAWHNYIISNIQAFGYVGLSIIMLWLLYAACISIRVGFAVNSFKGREYIYITLIQYICFVTFLAFSAHSTPGTFRQFSAVATLKLLYINLRENGHLTSIFQRKTYVPHMIKYDSDIGVRHNSLNA